MTDFDLLLKGGHVVDPATEVDDIADVGFSGGVVACVDSEIAGKSADNVVDVEGKVVMPGLVDLHAHFYYGVNSMPRDPRTDFLPCGTTCAVDAGSAGSANILNLREYVMRDSVVDLYAMINISALGLIAAGHLPFDDYTVIDVEATLQAINQDPERTVGIKLLLPSEDAQSDDYCIELLEKASRTSATAGLPLMVHIDGGLALETVCEFLKAGDMVTHCYQGNSPTLLGADGKIRPAIEAARMRGVLFDLAPGGGNHLSWDVAEACASQRFWPDCISTDYAWPPLVAGSTDPGAPRTLPLAMSIMLELGMPFDSVIRATTVTPARAVSLDGSHGSLQPGRTGDAFVAEWAAAPSHFTDMGGRAFAVNRALVPTLTVRRGVIAWSAGETLAASSAC